MPQGESRGYSSQRNKIPLSKLTLECIKAAVQLSFCIKYHILLKKISFIFCNSFLKCQTLKPSWQLNNLNRILHVDLRLACISVCYIKLASASKRRPNIFAFILSLVQQTKSNIKGDKGKDQQQESSFAIILLKMNVPYQKIRTSNPVLSCFYGYVEDVSYDRRGNIKTIFEFAQNLYFFTLWCEYV